MADICKFERVPDWLRKFGKFCFWRYEKDDKGKDTKVPYNPNKSGKRSSSTDMSTFADYETVKRVAGGYVPEVCGVGVGIFGNIGAIDIDDSVHYEENRLALSETATDIVNTMQSYTEVSPSGKGLRIFFLLPDGFMSSKGFTDAESYKKKYYVNNGRFDVIRDGLSHLEIYLAGCTYKYVSITGKCLSHFTELQECGDELMQVLDKYMQRSTSAEKPEGGAVSDNSAMGDVEIFYKACKGKNGEKFRKLYDGRWQELGYTSQSDADMSLCAILGFWYGGDAVRVDRMFRQSKLYRSKWEEKRGADTYGNITIQKALAGLKEVYNPDNGVDDGEYERIEQEWKKWKEGQGETDKAERFADFQARYCVENRLAEFLDGIPQEQPPIKSGFKVLDEVLEGGLYSALYIVGAIASLGKTTYCLQMADQLAEGGKDVLVFSLEMSRNELIAKSISRETLREVLRADKDIKLAKTQVGISDYSRYKRYSAEEKQIISKAINRVNTAISPRVYIIEPEINKSGFDWIRDTIQEFISVSGRKPIVIIDYLQILYLGCSGASAKEQTDNCVYQSKLLSRACDIPIILISAFNRNNYNTEANYSAFRESSSIEYSADVLLALQFKGVEGKDFNVEEAKSKHPRELELCVLKNRRGQSGIKINYQYYQKFNYFKEGELAKKYR